ncbi:hypothetical protein A2U01_0051781, partial [Trifolium medium]|nr:hypothetical protein [Trifolium medium]
PPLISKKSKQNTNTERNPTQKENENKSKPEKKKIRHRSGHVMRKTDLFLVAPPPPPCLHREKMFGFEREDADLVFLREVRENLF